MGNVNGRVIGSILKPCSSIAFNLLAVNSLDLFTLYILIRWQLLVTYVGQSNLPANRTYMETPIPRSTNISGLRIECIVPAAADDFQPSFRIDGQIHFPSPPGMLILLTQILRRNF